MANYLTKVYSKDDKSFNIKDAEAVSSISIIVDANSAKTLIPDENGKVTLDLSPYNVAKATDSSLGTVIIKNSYDSIDDTANSLKHETSLRLTSKGVLIADVPLKNIEIESLPVSDNGNKFETLKINEDTKTATINVATMNSTGLFKLGNNIRLDSRTYNSYLYLGNEKNRFNNVLIENEELNFNNFDVAVKKDIVVSNGKTTDHTAAASFTTKEYIYNTLIDYGKYLLNVYTTKEDTKEIKDELIKITNNDEDFIFNNLIKENKFSKKYISGINELPDISNPDNSTYNTLYILKSVDDNGYYGNYVYTPKKVDNSYKWICVSSPANTYELEDINFAKEFKKYYSYSKISKSKSFKNFTALSSYLQNEYNTKEKAKYIIDGNSITAIKTELVANGEVFEYTYFDVLVSKQGTSYQFYFYTPEYTETSKYIISTSSTANSTLYNGFDITTELFNPEES